MPRLQGGEQALDGLGGVGAVGEDLFERFLAGANFRDLVFQLVDFVADGGGGVAALAQILLRAQAVDAHAFEFHLALGEGLGDLPAGDIEAFDFGGGELLFAHRAGLFALDSGEVLFDLGELVFERGRLAQQAQNQLAAGFDGLFALAQAILQGIALLVDFEHAIARLRDLGFQRVEVLAVGGDFGVEAVEALAQFLRFRFPPGRCAARWTPLSFTCAASRPRVRSASTLESESCWRAAVSCSSDS